MPSDDGNPTQQRNPVVRTGERAGRTVKDTRRPDSWCSFVSGVRRCKAPIRGVKSVCCNAALLDTSAALHQVIHLLQSQHIDIEATDLVAQRRRGSAINGFAREDVPGSDTHLRNLIGVGVEGRIALSVSLAPLATLEWCANTWSDTRYADLCGCSPDRSSSR